MTRMKPILVLIIFMFAIQNSSCNTFLMEYLFYGYSNGTTVFYPSSNTTYAYNFYTPVGLSGPGYASSEPYMHSMGVHIKYNNYVRTNYYINGGSVNSYTMLGLYIYYISGTLGEFANLEIEMPVYNKVGYFTLEGKMSGTSQIIELCMSTFCMQFGSIEPGWNFIMFGGSDYYFLYSSCNNGNACSGGNYATSNYYSLLNATNTQRTLGCYSCTDTSVEYIIHSLTVTDGSTYYSNINIDDYIGATNTFPNATLCGNGVRDAGEGCDDTNEVSGDGCSFSCDIEIGYDCTGGTSTTADTCYDECGDGLVYGTVTSTYCDDGNNVSGDGCSATCVVETGYECLGGSTTTSDSCQDYCGDGFVYGTVDSNHCDDGNSDNGDGCNMDCLEETGYTCSGGSTTGPDTCYDYCGDGFVNGLVSVDYCDDGNNVSGDGCSSSCLTETGYECTGGSTTTSDTCTDLCGDGLVYYSSTPGYCDDGDTVSNDGCSSSCLTEAGYTCTAGSTSTSSVCSDLCGDGLVYGSVSANYCDDGNGDNGDGCNSLCQTETGYTCTGGSTTTADICSDFCGDGFVYGTVSSTYCDDGNVDSSDGCSSSCETETGFTCTGGSTSSSSTCTDICGDGRRYGPIIYGYCDDGNFDNGDGCDSSCQTESGYNCGGGSTTGPDTCGDYCGDGFTFGAVSSNHCDDGNNDSNDGCSSSCTTEYGYTCIGASTTTPSTCIDICGDGMIYGTVSVDYCDDGNSTPNDGCDEDCVTETGYECSGGDNTRADTCYAKCGDGIILGSEECDDGNLVSQDGCNSECILETGFDCTNGLGNPATTCDEICGDGLKFSTAGCDDGNLVSGDGCSNSCTVESGYSCAGGSSSSADTCLIVCGDGVISGDFTTNCDDGNSFGGDGCSSECKIEDGYTCASEPSICTEKCGDGRRIGPGCDDGNLEDGDGCSSVCTEETGFTCTGGSPTKKDTCVEECGDGEDYGQHECEDGNLVDGDGCSSTCEYETCYECIGGSPSSVDICTTLQIEAKLTSNTGSTVELVFDHPMQNNSISISDLAIDIQSNHAVDFSWTANYISSDTLKINLNFDSMLFGGEIMTVRFINYKVFRGPNGGCVITEELSTKMSNSLQSSTDSAKSMSGVTEYLIFGGILIAFGAIMILGGSLEMVWSMVNTLQIITFLPLMTPYYPEHVKIMFKILEFVNMDFEYVSLLFSKILNIDGLNAPAYNSRFVENGIDSPLFLTNCASLLMSLILTILFLCSLVILYCFCRFEKCQIKISSIISSYFWNNFLRFFTEGYLEFTFGALLNLASFTHKSTPEYVSLGLSGFTCLLCILFPFMTAALLYDNRKTISEGNEKYLKRFGTMYKEFKTDKEWYHFQYYPTFLIRRLVFAVFLILLIDYPETQCNSFIFFSFLIFCYQALAKPFNDEIVNVLSCINEGILGFISLIQIIFVTDLNDPTIIDRTGWIMVSMMIIMVLLNFGIILPYSIRQKWVNLRKDNNNKVKQVPENSEIDQVVDLSSVRKGETIREILQKARQGSRVFSSQPPSKGKKVIKNFNEIFKK